MLRCLALVAMHRAVALQSWNPAALRALARVVRRSARAASATDHAGNTHLPDQLIRASRFRHLRGGVAYGL